MPRAGNTSGDVSERGNSRNTATAPGVSGTMCDLWFLDRLLGMVQRPPSRSNSSHRMPTTSPRRWAVSMRSCTMRPNG